MPAISCLPVPPCQVPPQQRTHPKPAPLVQRLLRLRRTRQKMPRQELQAWREDYGMNLRSLPPAYSQQWERRLLELGTEGEMQAVGACSPAAHSSSVHHTLAAPPQVGPPSTCMS